MQAATSYSEVMPNASQAVVETARTGRRWRHGAKQRFDALRPGILARGVLWGAATLRHYGAQCWRDLTIRQLDEIQRTLAAG